MIPLLVRMGVLLATIAAIQGLIAWRGKRHEPAVEPQCTDVDENYTPLLVEMTRPSDDLFESRPALGLSLVALVVGVTIHSASIRGALYVIAVSLAAIDIGFYCFKAWFVKRR